MCQVTASEFQGILDRVATTADCTSIRDNIILFLQVKVSISIICLIINCIFTSSQKYLVDIPRGLPDDERKSVEKRRKLTLRTMEAMSVLDITKELNSKEMSD